MRRTLPPLAIAGLLGLALTLSGSEARAEGRARAAKAAKPAKAGRKVPTKGEPKQAEPASFRTNDPVTGDSAPAASGAPPSRGPARIDFDDRLIQGQTNKSGAVYLYDRKELKTRSMIHERENFRSEILSTVYDRP